MFEDTEQAEPESYCQAGFHNPLADSRRETRRHAKLLREWVESSPPAEAKQIRELGLDVVLDDNDNRERNCWNIDKVAPSEIQTETIEATRSEQRVMFRLLGDIQNSSRPEVVCAAFISLLGGWDHDESVEKIAARYGIKRQQFSELRARISDAYGLKGATARCQAGVRTPERRARQRKLNQRHWMAVIPSVSRVAGWINQRRADRPKLTDWPREFAHDLIARLQPIVTLESDLREILEAETEGDDGRGA